MEPLTIVLIVLAIVAIWAVAEMAITIRKARAALDEISHSATEAIDQVTPVVSKLDGVVDELQPALREVPPMMGKVSTLMDDASVSLNSVNGILGDVGAATHGVAGVGESATRIVNTATSAAVGVVSKVASLGGITIPEGQQLIGKGDSQSDAPASAPAEEEERPAHKGGYVTYAPVSADEPEE